MRALRSRRVVEAHTANAKLSRDLGIPRNAPVLKLINVSFGADTGSENLVLLGRLLGPLDHYIVVGREAGLDDRIEHRAGGQLQPLDPLVRAAQAALA